MHVIGVDIGGTSIKLAIVDTEHGTALLESSFPTPMTGAADVASETARHVRDLRAAFPEVERLGVGVPGAMNRDRTLVRFPPNLQGWREEPLAQLLCDRLPEFSVVEVDNDAKVATLAEATLGAGRGESHFLLVTLGTGVGGGLWVTEGVGEARFTGIFRGASGGAGEFGHVSIDHQGPQCGCGARGCIEAYLGQRYLSARTKEKLRIDPSIQTTLRNVNEELTPRIIADAMNAGDRFAREVFEEAGTLLGVALANVAKLLDVHLFIVGGGVASAGDVLFDAARRSLVQSSMENLRPVVEIRKAMFGNKAGVIGAALLAAAA